MGGGVELFVRGQLLLGVSNFVSQLFEEGQTLGGVSYKRLLKTKSFESINLGFCYFWENPICLWPTEVSCKPTKIYAEKYF